MLYSGWRVVVLAGWRVVVLDGWSVEVLAGWRVEVLAGWRVLFMGGLCGFGVNFCKSSRRCVLISNLIFGHVRVHLLQPTLHHYIQA